MGAVVTAKSGYDIGYPVRGLGRAGERSVGGYYASAAQAGEALGRWFGRGAASLGLAEGQRIYTDAEIAAYEAVYSQVHPVTGEQLGRKAANSGQAGAERREAYLERLLAAEPHATAERRRYLAWQATIATRPTAPYTDVTVSWSKSISVLHVSIRENARQARLAGHARDAEWWDAQERKFSDILQPGNRAALAHLEQWSGFYPYRVARGPDRRRAGDRPVG
jgi:TrwC relaxase